MMGTTTLTLLAGSIVVVGRWTQDKPVNARVVIGIVGSAVGISLIGSIDEGLGNGFAGILLVSVVFVYLVPILQKVGLVS